jgi:hypothetical protein
MKNWEPWCLARQVGYGYVADTKSKRERSGSTRTVGVWTRIGHREDACAGEPEFRMYFVFTASKKGVVVSVWGLVSTG